MEDKLTPLEAEVLEMPEDGASCQPPKSTYGTAVPQKPKKSRVGLWVFLGLCVILLCSAGVFLRVFSLRLTRDAGGGFHLVLRNGKTVSAEPESEVKNLPAPAAEGLEFNGIKTGTQTPRLTVDRSEAEALDPVELYRQAAPSVVCLTMDSYYGSWSCTGVGVSEDGLVLCASDFSLSYASEIEATLSDGTLCAARLVAEDELTGICLVKLEDVTLRPARFCEPGSVPVGQRVYSIGNPYGADAVNILSDGLLSVQQQLELEGQSYLLLQSDAGARGGYGCPLYDAAGRILGITTPVGKRFIRRGEDPCFAVTTADLQRILDGFASEDSADTVWLGMEVGLIPEEYRSYYGLPGELWITDLSPETAAALVMYPNDVIIAVDGQSVSTPEEFRAALAKHRPGDWVELTFFRVDTTYAVSLPVYGR